MEQVRSSLEQTEKGKVSNAAANYKRVFQLDPLLKGAIRKNLLTERVDIVKPLGWYRDSPTLTDVDIKYLLLYFEENYGLTIEKKIQDAVMVIANENRYHPVRDFLNALQWDGTERIRYCLHRFLGADTDDYTCEAMRLFLLGESHGRSVPAVNLKSCFVWWEVREPESPRSFGCWQFRMTGFPMT